MKRTWLSAFAAGFLAGVLALGTILALTDTTPAVAQLPPGANEEIQILREMSASLKGIEQALRQIEVRDRRIRMPLAHELSVAAQDRRRVKTESDDHKDAADDPRRRLVAAAVR